MHNDILQLRVKVSKFIIHLIWLQQTNRKDMIQQQQIFLSIEYVTSS